MWPYTFPTPLAAIQAQGYTLPKGTNLNLVGVDGRVTGVLRRFPGFNALRRLETGGDFSSAFSQGYWGAYLQTAHAAPYWIDGNFFKYAEIQKDASGYMLRGFVASLTNGGLRFYYYDTQTTSWGVYNLLPPGSMNHEGLVDVSYGGIFLYVALRGSQGTTTLWQNGGLVSFTFGHVGASDISSLVTVSSPNAGQLLADAANSPIYTVAYRWGDSKRGVWSPLVQRDAIAVNPATNYVLRFQIPITAAQVTQYDTLEVYRTIANGGILYREIFLNVPSLGAPYNTADPASLGTMANFAGFRGTGVPVLNALGVAGGTLDVWLGGNAVEPITLGAIISHPPVWGTGAASSDIAIVFQPQYDAVADDIGDVPKGDRIFAAGGITYKTLGDETAFPEVAWSRTDGYYPENFPGANSYRTARASDQIERFISNADSVCAYTRARTYRFTQVSGSMMAERLLHGVGASSYGGVAEFPAGNAVAGTAHLSIESPTGDLATVGLLDHVFYGNAPDFMISYDAVGECLFLIDPSDGGLSFCVWGGTNTVTTLGRTRFSGVTSGPKPDDPDITPDMSFFLARNGTVLYADFWGTQNSCGMGVNTAKGTFNAPFTGTALTGSWDTTYGNDTLAHTYFYLVSAATGIVHAVKVSGNTSTTLTLASSITASAGDLYYVGVLPFQWVGRPLWDVENPPSYSYQTPETLARRMTTAAMFDLWAFSVPGDPNQTMIATIYDKVVDLTADTPQGVLIPINRTQADKNVGKLIRGGPTLTPSLICLEPTFQFDLLQATISGSVESTQKSSQG